MCLCISVLFVRSLAWSFVVVGPSRPHADSWLGRRYENIELAQSVASHLLIFSCCTIDALLPVTERRRLTAIARGGDGVKCISLCEINLNKIQLSSD